MRFRVLLSLLFCVACAAGIARTACADDLPDAATVMARVSAAEGTPPPNLRTVLRVVGTTESFTQTTYRLDKDVRTVHDAGKLVTESGTNNGDHWIRNANGLVIIVEPDPPETTREVHTATVSRSTSPDALVVSDLTKSGYGTRTFVDPVTAHVLRRVTIGPNETITTDYQTYQTYGANTVPMQWTVTNSRTSETDQYQRAEYTTGVVTAADVALPNSPTLVTFPPGVASVKLPASFETQKIVVHASVGGRPFNFILDTGADEITISPALAQQLGLPTINQHNQVVAGKVRIGQAIVPEIRIGPLVMHDIVVGVVPFHADLQRDGVDGLLGFDFLAELGVRIDYDAQTVTVSPGDAFTPPAEKDVYQFDIRLGTSQPMITATFDGARADRMILDTGGGGTFLLFDYFARRNPAVFRNSLFGEGMISGVGGTVPVTAWRFANVRIGLLDFQNFTGFRAETSHSFAYANEDGLIGFDFLRFFTIWLDYEHGQIFLKQNRYHGEASR